MSKAKRRLRFGLKTLFALMAVVAIFCTFVAYPLIWIRQREAWRSTTSGAIFSSESNAAPKLLALFGEKGESWIELKNATGEQLAHVQQLFPEASVVKWQDQPAASPVPSVAPIAPPSRPLSPPST